jgi:hypothetical protein
MENAAWGDLVENTAWGELGDRQLFDMVEVEMSATVGEAIEQARGRWVVIMQSDGTTMSAVDSTTLGRLAAERTIGSVLADLPPVVTAAAETPVGYLVHSWMADELEPGSAFVAVSHGRVSGVWAGQDMRSAVAFAASRSLWDPELPGDIQIPLLTRRCRYSAGGVTCTSVAQFAERPDPTPPCANPIPLTAHRFEW